MSDAKTASAEAPHPVASRPPAPSGRGFEAIDIRPVSGIGDFLAFCRAPRLLYAGQKGFAPSLDAERCTLYAHKLNPHYKRVHSQAFLARRDGKIVGRIEAQIYKDILPTGASPAQFGTLDAIDDVAVVRALTGAAEAWLRAKGATIVNGPFSPSVNSESGLLVEGFDAVPMIFMPWHPPWLGRHLEACGYEKAKDLISYRYDITDDDRTRPAVLQSRPEWQKRLRFRPLKLKELKSEAQIMVDLFNDGWAGNWGFAPMGLDELMSTADALKFVITEDYGFVTELDGEPVAFGIVIPNLHEATADLGGRLLPFGLPKVVSRIKKKNYKSARLALFGLKRKLHRSATGGVVVLAMIEELRLRSRRVDLDHVEFGWVLEDNTGMRRPIEMSGARIDKVHRIYGKRLTAAQDLKSEGQAA